MTAIRALSRRLIKLESAKKPRKSPISNWYGSIDEWVDQSVIPAIQSGAICPREMADVVAAVRKWEEEGCFPIA